MATLAAAILINQPDRGGHHPIQPRLRMAAAVGSNLYGKYR